jgi:acyl-coenzyme A thioesterase PaaI-like protein
MNDLKHLIIKLGDDTSNCYVCGQANKLGLQIPFVRDGEHGSSACYTARPEHEGWPGVLHGGITFALMDESLGWALYFQGIRGVTARVQTQFKQPIRTGMSLRICGWTLERRRKLITARAEIRMDSPESALMADMDATMFLLADNAPQKGAEYSASNSLTCRRR